MSDEIRGLSLTQPWATLMAIGAKRIETRSWPTHRRGLLAIHAAKGFPRDAIALCHEEPFESVLKAAGIRVPADLPRGAIVAVANLHQVGRIFRRLGTGEVYVTGQDLPVTGDELAFGDYTPGRFGWLLEDVRALPEPIPCRGALGLWELPAEVAVQIEQQLAAGGVH